MKHRIPGTTGHFLLGLFLLFGIFAQASAFPDAQGYTVDDCMECHSPGSEESSLHISPENYDASVHGQAVTCLECHTGITDKAHMEGEGVDPVDCTGCHEMETGKMDLFSIFSSSQIVSHNKASFINIYKMDNCLGCHQGTGTHGETEPINDQDCYKCHDPNSKDAMWGYMHPDTKDKGLIVVIAHICFAVFILVLLFRLFLAPVFNNFSSKKNTDKNNTGENNESKKRDKP